MKKLLTLFLLCLVTFTAKAQTHDGYAVFVYDQTGWSNLRLYMWGDVNDLNGGWPGMTVTGTQAVSGKEYKYFDMGAANTDKAEHLIFNNGSGTQLGDYNFTINRDIYLKVTSSGVTEITDPANPEGTVVNAISTVSLAGSFNGWNTSATPFTPVTQDEEYSLTLDLSTETGNIEFKFLPNGQWLGWGAVTFTGETDWVSDSGNGGNILLANSNSGYKTYILTATWAGGTNTSAGWTIDLQGGERREAGQLASVNSLTIAGGFNSWNSTANPLAEITANAEYTYDIDMTDDPTGDFEFKLVANGNHWMGWDKIQTINAPDGWIEQVSVDGAYGNIKLKNSTAGYKTYKLTATWEQNADIETGWALTIEGVDPRTEPVQHTYQIAGTGDLGLSWTPSDNPMTEDNGTWTLTKSGLTLFPGNYAYKLVQDGSTWIPDGTGNDHQLTISEIGVYDVVFTMTEPTDAGYTAVATKTAGFTFSVAGNDVAIFGNAWWEDAEGDAANAMTLTNGKYVWNKTGVQLTAGEKQYRIRVNGAYVEGAPWDIDGFKPGNKAVTVDADGYYDITITFNPATKTVTETFTSADAPAQPTVFYVVNEDPEGWPQLALYNWGDISGETLGAWPGVVLYDGTDVVGNEYVTVTKEGNNYTVTLSADLAYENLILNNNNDGKQIDLSDFEDGKTYTIPAPIADAYVIAGDEYLMGEGWNTTSEANTMTNDNGVWTLTKTGVTLLPGTYGYKYVNNGTWADGDNHELTISELGVYDVTFTVDESDLANYTAVATKTDVDFTLSVAGSDGAIFGNVWWEDADGDAANAMTLTDGKYVWTKTAVLLTAGEKQYRVRINGQYTTDGGFPYNGNGIFNITGINNNKVVNIEEGNYYNITITFDPANRTVTEVFEATDVEKTSVYYVDMQNWGLKAHAWNAKGQVGVSEFFEPVSTKTVNVFGYDFTKYEFSIPADATYLNFGIEGWEHKTSDMPFIAGATYANDGDEPNGIVLFTDDAEQFQPAEDVNVNVKASYARKFEVGKTCTVVLPFAMPADQTAGTFYTLTSVTDGVIHGESVAAPAPYVPYIFEPATEYPFTNINVGQLPKAQVNTINAAGNAKMTFALEQTTLRSDAETTYYGWGTSEGFTKVAVGLAAPFRAWIEMPTVQANANSLVWMNDVVTGIDKVNVEISNGAKVYDLQGRQVTNPTARGIYIVNGKKYVVK